MNFKERLLKFLKYLKLGQTKFEESTGLGRASISKIKDGMSAPNLAKIIKAYPELNIEWLIAGEGEMLKTDAAAGADQVTIISADDKAQKVLLDLINQKDKRIEELVRENERLRDDLKAYEEKNRDYTNEATYRSVAENEVNYENKK